ncbi:MAG: YitT family protein [Cytophagales bacterium]|nr:YitT family protein [Cytophagales bacterium]
MKRQPYLKVIKEYSLICLGIVMFVIGWTAFIIPSNISGGGVSGISTVVFQLTGIPVAFSYLGINLFLLVLGVNQLGRSYGLKVLFGVALSSLLFWAAQRAITEPVVSDLFMAAIIGGAIAGAGVGIILAQGGSLGGTDIISSIVAAKRHIAQGRLLLYMDMVIIGATYFISYKLESIMYASVVMFAMTYMVDQVLTGRNASIQMFIFSKNHERIALRIQKEVNRGMTILDAHGWYSKEQKKVIMIIMRRSEYVQVLSIAKKEDPNAFISIGSVMGVFGEGFEKIKA